MCLSRRLRLLSAAKSAWRGMGDVMLCECGWLCGGFDECACVRLTVWVGGWHGGHIVKASKSLKTRQAVRALFEEEQKKLRDRKEMINSLLSLLDQRDEVDVKIGAAARELIELGEKKSTVRELIGVSAKELSDLLSQSEDDDEKPSAPAGDDGAPREENSAAGIRRGSSGAVSDS